MKLQSFVLGVGIGLLGCSDADAPTGERSLGGTTTVDSGGATSSGGAAVAGGGGGGGTSSTGGLFAAGGGAPATGGAAGGSLGGGPTVTGGTAPMTGGSPASGGTTGGSSATGGSSTTGGACTAGPPLTGGTPYCASGLGSLGNGYSYEIWIDPASTGTNCGTMYGVEAAFRADWDLGSGGDFLARAGLSLGSTQTVDQLGTLSADYAFTKTGNGFAFIGVYGWTFEPLVEYYIIEDWNGWRPAIDYSLEGTLSVDGGTYDIFRNRRLNAASPAGMTDFDQFWSVRREGRQCGHVSISEHFSRWASLGMEMGRMREAMLLLEALNGSGTVDFSAATVRRE